MKNLEKIQFGLVAIMIVICAGCKNSSEIKSNDLNPIDSQTVVSGSENISASISKTNFELLQGKWQHTTDTTNYLWFENNIRKEIAEGLDDLESEPFLLLDQCINSEQETKAINLEKEKYIRGVESELCWYIIELDEKILSLSFVGRGNSLTYYRVK